MHIADELHRETGISPIVFGIGGQGGSAVSFDRLMFKSMAKGADSSAGRLKGYTPEVLDAHRRAAGRYVVNVGGRSHSAAWRNVRRWCGKIWARGLST